jgi:hypothetical protein
LRRDFRALALNQAEFWVCGENLRMEGKRLATPTAFCLLLFSFLIQKTTTFLSDSGSSQTVAVVVFFSSFNNN